MISWFDTSRSIDFTIAVLLILAVLGLGKIARRYRVGMPDLNPLELINGNLKIDGTKYGGPVPLACLQLEQSRVVNLTIEKSLLPKTRIMGIDTPAYKSGFVKLRDGQTALVFITELTSVLYIPTQSDYALLLSVSDPVAFLDSLRPKKLT